VKLLDLTLPTPAENLSLDEALLESAEAVSQPTEILRIWEAVSPHVVVGRASKLAEEVNLEACRERGIPVFRRTSGGAAVVAGPGCMMYAVVLNYDKRPFLRALDQCHQFVMSKIADPLAKHVEGIQFLGTCDLTWNDRKFSGNSLRCKRSNVLYHGTLLYDFDLSLVSQLLRHPPRMPGYRNDRQHSDFVANLRVSRDVLRTALIDAWDAEEETSDWPREMTATLASEKYNNDAWNALR